MPHVLVQYRKPGLSLPKTSLALEMDELKYSSKLGLTTLKEICMGQIWAFNSIFCHAQQATKQLESDVWDQKPALRLKAVQQMTCTCAVYIHSTINSPTPLTCACTCSGDKMASWRQVRAVLVPFYFLCLQLLAAGRSPGVRDFADETNIQLWECNGSQGQKWWIFVATCVNTQYLWVRTVVVTTHIKREKFW